MGEFTFTKASGSCQAGTEAIYANWLLLGATPVFIYCLSAQEKSDLDIVPLLRVPLFLLA